MNHIPLRKKISRTAVVLSSTILMLALFNSCKKENTGSSAGTVSEEEAVEAITQSVSGESGSLDQQSQDACVLANAELSLLACGTTLNSTVTGSNPPGAIVPYSFSFDWSWILSCSNSGVPQKVNFNINGHSSYDAQRMSSNDNCTALFEFTDLMPSFDEYNMNSNYQRNGTQQSKVGEKNSFTSTTNILSSDIKVSKTSQLITSGTATVNISGASTSGKTFNYSGNIVFHGNKTATLTMASGHIFELSW